MFENTNKHNKSLHSGRGVMGSISPGLVCGNTRCTGPSREIGFVRGDILDANRKVVDGSSFANQLQAKSGSGANRTEEELLFCFAWVVRLGFYFSDCSRCRKRPSDRQFADIIFWSMPYLRSMALFTVPDTKQHPQRASLRFFPKERSVLASN